MLSSKPQPVGVAYSSIVLRGETILSTELANLELITIEHYYLERHTHFYNDGKILVFIMALEYNYNAREGH